MVVDAFLLVCLFVVVGFFFPVRRVLYFISPICFSPLTVNQRWSLICITFFLLSVSFLANFHMHRI